MTKEMIETKKKLNRIICDLIVKNMENGSSYKKAKTQTFNRLEKDSPEIINLWIGLYK